MMEEQKHNLESLFEKQLNASPPSFDPAYWEQAQATIERLEQGKKRKRRGGLLFSLIALLCIGAGTTYMFWPSAQANEQHTQSLTSSSVMPPTAPAQDNLDVMHDDDASDEDSDSFSQPIQADNNADIISNIPSLTSKSSQQPIPTPQNIASQQIKSSDSFLDKTVIDITIPVLPSQQSDVTSNRTSTKRKAYETLVQSSIVEEVSLWGNLDLQANTLSVNPVRHSHWHLYAEAGATANPGFLPAGERSLHIAPYYQIGASRRFGRKFQVGLGLGYTTLSGISRTASREEVSLTFIRNTRTEVLHHNQSQWLTLPLTWEYSLVPGLNIVGGARLSYLLQTQGILETIEENDFGQKISSQAPVRQYMDGLSRLNYQLEAGLAFRPGARWEIRGMAIRGLRSITSGDVLNGGGNDKTLQLQVGVRWYLR